MKTEPTSSAGASPAVSAPAVTVRSAAAPSAARRSAAPWLLAALAVAAVALFPVLVSNPYYLHLGETILIYAIVLFGLDIVVGYTGQVSLGHAGLFGIGAYTAGVLVL